MTLAKLIHQTYCDVEKANISTVGWGVPLKCPDMTLTDGVSMGEVNRNLT